MNTWTAVAPVLLLIISNVFMTFAWYGQLNVQHRALWLIILISWGIAFLEYCLAVPANRIGRLVYSPAQLKAMQEVITLSVFAVFSATWLKAPVNINQLIDFVLIAAGAFFVFKAPL